MNPAAAGLCRLGFNLGDAIIDGARTVVPRLGELVIAAAMRAAERELITLAGGVHDRQLTAMLASHSNVSGAVAGWECVGGGPATGIDGRDAVGSLD